LLLDLGSVMGGGGLCLSSLNLSMVPLELGSLGLLSMSDSVQSLGVDPLDLLLSSSFELDLFGDSLSNGELLGLLTLDCRSDLCLSSGLNGCSAS
jgi:hypothetical protein